MQKAADKLWEDAVWAGILHACAELRQEDFDWLLDLPSFLKLPGVVIDHAAMHDIENWPYPVHETIAEIKACGLPMKSALRLSRGV